jgi:hypothetical protein
VAADDGKLTAVAAPADSAAQCDTNHFDEPPDSKAPADLKTPAGAAAAAAGSALLVASPYAEIEWTQRRLLYFPWLMFAAGAFSGLLGAAPNTLFLAPYLMMAGCHPQVR